MSRKDTKKEKKAEIAKQRFLLDGEEGSINFFGFFPIRQLLKYLHLIDAYLRQLQQEKHKVKLFSVAFIASTMQCSS